MEPLIESGKQWFAQWRLASTAARWGFAVVAAALAAAAIAAATGLAVSNWPQSDALVPLIGGDLLAATPLTAAQVTAMEAAFGKAQLNEAQVVGRSISVPRSKRHLYLKALVDQKALPAHAFAYTERFLASDHPFSSSRQRDEAAKLAKAQEVSLILQKISGVEEASVLFEDSDLGGFPRRKTRKAVAAVRANGGKPLPSTMISAIRGTVQGTLGIQDQQSVTILDLNAGVTHTASTPSARDRRPESYRPAGAEANLPAGPNTARPTSDRQASRPSSTAIDRPPTNPTARDRRGSAPSANHAANHAANQVSTHHDSPNEIASPSVIARASYDSVADTFADTVADTVADTAADSVANTATDTADIAEASQDPKTNALVQLDSQTAAGMSQGSRFNHGIDPGNEHFEDKRLALELREAGRAPTDFAMHVDAAPLLPWGTAQSDIEIRLAASSQSDDALSNPPDGLAAASSLPTRNSHGLEPIGSQPVAVLARTEAETATAITDASAVRASDDDRSSTSSDGSSASSQASADKAIKGAEQTARTDSRRRNAADSQAAISRGASRQSPTTTQALDLPKPRNSGHGDTQSSRAGTSSSTSPPSSSSSSLSPSSISSVTPGHFHSEHRQPVATSIRPLAQTVRLWVRDNLLTLGGSLLGVGLLAKLARSLSATRPADRERRQAPKAPRSSHEGERSGKRRLREQIQADPGSAAAALKQWMGNAA
jgi:hypothetical protein